MTRFYFEYEYGHRTLSFDTAEAAVVYGLKQETASNRLLCVYYERARDDMVTIWSAPVPIFLKSKMVGSRRVLEPNTPRGSESDGRGGAPGTTPTPPASHRGPHGCLGPALRMEED